MKTVPAGRVADSTDAIVLTELSEEIALAMSVGRRDGADGRDA